jgi:hypothetical protein
MDERRKRLERSRIAPSYKKIRTLPVTYTQQQKAKICKDRRVRREVLHALKKNGLKGQKSPQFKHPTVKCYNTKRRK